LVKEFPLKIGKLSVSRNFWMPLDRLLGCSAAVGEEPTDENVERVADGSCL